MNAPKSTDARFGMHYMLPEDKFNKLVDVAGLLGLIAAVGLAVPDRKRIDLLSGDLLATLAIAKGAIDEVLGSMTFSAGNPE